MLARAKIVLLKRTIRSLTIALLANVSWADPRFIQAGAL